jgi:CheY-like chemotaxis protein
MFKDAMDRIKSMALCTRNNTNQKILPKLIMMDVSLKGRMDGIEAAKQIRRKYPVPIIFISGYQEEKLMEKARSLKFTIYLIKPIMSDDIKSAIAQTFGNNSVS